MWNCPQICYRVLQFYNINATGKDGINFATCIEKNKNQQYKWKEIEQRNVDVYFLIMLALNYQMIKKLVLYYLPNNICMHNGNYPANRCFITMFLYNY